MERDVNLVLVANCNVHHKFHVSPAIATLLGEGFASLERFSTQRGQVFQKCLLVGFGRAAALLLVVLLLG